MLQEKDWASDASLSEEAGSRFNGRVFRLVQMNFDDGSSITAPAEEASFGLRSASDTVGDIISIACKIFPGLCGGGGGGGGTTNPNPGCYTIIGPDGTKITICPPPQGGPA